MSIDKFGCKDTKKNEICKFTDENKYIQTFAIKKFMYICIGESVYIVIGNRVFFFIISSFFY